MDNEVKTQHVLDLIKQEQDMRALNQSMRIRTKDSLHRAFNDLSSFNRTVGIDIKQ